MARFRSGTLERSVRRWGRFPGAGGRGGKLQRVTHGWKYVTLGETALNLTTPNNNPTVVSLFDSGDFAPSTTGTGCKNVVFDLRVVTSWSPSITAVAYDSWSFRAGIFCVDVEDDTGTHSSAYAEKRAIWWNFTGRNTGEQPATFGISNENRAFTWVARGRQRWVDFDEELRIVAGFTDGVDSVISDARLSIFGRISWENP